MLVLYSQIGGDEMNVRTITIENLISDRLQTSFDRVHHVKTLHCLAITQPLYGWYEVSLSGRTSLTVQPGGVFVVPTGVSQDIWHHDGENGYMEAQWVFMNVVVNGVFALEDLFHLPSVLSPEQAAGVADRIAAIRNSKTLCSRYAEAYRLVDWLLSHATPRRTEVDNAAARLKRYVYEHYRESITKEELAQVAICSVSNLYRLFQKHFRQSPHNYINRIRMEQAAVLLESSDQSVAEIAQQVGLNDPVYFSKLFKEYCGRSPQAYRKSLLFPEKTPPRR